IENSLLSLSFQHRKSGLSVDIESESIKGFLFMDRDAVPEQHDGTLVIRRMSVRKDFSYKKWHMENRIRLQQISDESILRLPAFHLVHSVYWENDLLNKAFILTAGIRFRYQSSYYADAFMPASNTFYLQDSISCAGQPIFDLFTDMRIKGATIYLSANNILQGIASNAFYMTPFYPQAGMTYRFGVRWFFLDQ
ncbi:MAG: putative porin, partial [Bacteroidota bacterium]